MLDKLFPRTVDNTYQGSRSALWLLSLVALVMAAQGVAVIVAGHSVVRDADGIPLDTYPAAAVQTIEALWAQRGLSSRLVIALLSALALTRYRSAVPFMLLLIAAAYLAGEVIFYFIPVVRVGTPGGPIVNLVLFVLTLIGLALSLRTRERAS